MANGSGARVYEIILDEQNGTRPPKLGSGARSKIRSHAMRDFRRKQRENQGQAHAKLDFQTITAPPSGKPDTSLTHPSIPAEPSIAGDFFRYTLVEMFGASLIGASPRIARSPVITNYRIFVATTKSEAMRAIDDSLCLVLPACQTNDTRMILETRKRHLAGIKHLQETLKGHVSDPATAVACATELLIFAFFKPFQSNVTALYDGVVSLARTYSTALQTGATPQSTFISIQLRQMLLLRALADGTALPIPSDTWRDPSLTSVLPDITESLMQQAVKLPDLLVAAREATSSAYVDLPTIKRLLSSLLSLEAGLLHWQATNCSQPSQGAVRLPFREADDDTAVERFGTSPNHPILSLHCQAMCHICVLLLRVSLMKLYQAKHDFLMVQYYTTSATLAADALCQLTASLIDECDGLFGKALSAYAPLLFAGRWYEMNNDHQGVAWVAQQESRLQKEVPFLSWESLLPMALVSMYMQM